MSDEIELPEGTFDDLQAGVREAEKLERFYKKLGVANIDVQVKMAETKKRKSEFLALRDAFYPGKPL